MDNKDSKKTPQRKRARQTTGQFKGDNPGTPGFNEAWEPTAIEEALPSTKEVKYTVKQKVDGTSNDTAGKYSKPGKVRPTFGSVTTTTF